MTEARVDPAMVEVWASMADHFLDNDSRASLPLSALRCVQAGLSAAQARDIWQYEVAPAVDANLLSFAGEWAGWDRGWLTERILQLRSNWWNRPGPARKFHLLLLLSRRDRLAMERCIEFLRAIREPAAREQVAQDLADLSRLMIDLPTIGPPIVHAQNRARLSQLYPAPFKALMWPVLYPSEVALAERNIHSALAIAR